MHLIDNFPSVKKAMRLDISYWDCKRLPTDAALHHFERLETIVMDAASVYDEPSFWSDLFAVRAFRRVPNFLIVAAHREYREEVDAAAVFDFITDFSLMPAGKPRVVSLGRFNNVNKASLNAVKRRLNKNNASIGGQACVVIRDLHNVERYLSNMASGGKLRTLAKKLLRKASGVPAVNHV